jgi:hypothetical protein
MPLGPLFLAHPPSGLTPEGGRHMVFRKDKVEIGSSGLMAGNHV